MRSTGILNLLRIIGVMVVVFGLLSLGLNIYTYQRIKPEIKKLEPRLDEVHDKISAEMEHVSLLLDDGEKIMNEFAEKSDFNQNWWEPFVDIEKDIRLMADSLDKINSGLKTSQSDLDQVKEALKLQIGYLDSYLLITFMYSSFLHIVLVLIGVSLILIEGNLIQTGYRLDQVPMAKIYDPEKETEVAGTNSAPGSEDHPEKSKGNPPLSQGNT